ncbi:TIGR02679 family protein [Pseudonocardia sp.]|uniref:TIGR02679 family protein n=1 Tax=Pseudonocardia sp. TaxID=60912 RepID=UPI003D0B00A1
MTTEPGWERLLAAARRSLERTGGRLDARVGLADPTEAERRTVIGLTGRHRAPGTARLSVTLAELDAGLRRTRGESLVEALCRTGAPLRDRPAERAAEAAGRDAVLAALTSVVHGGQEWFAAWRDGLVADGTLTRLVRRGEPHLVPLAAAVLDRLPALAAPSLVAVPLPVLAEEVTGDPKALSGGTLPQLVLRALALREVTDVPATAEARRALWDAAGVVVDDLASQVLVLNLPADGDGLGSWLTDAAARGIPLRITLHQLVTLPVTPRVDRVSVCENPAVLRAAAGRLGPHSGALVCTEGVPSTACWRLLGAAVDAGAEVHWRNDFDWAGLRITASALARVSARPWRMGASDYLAALAAGETEPLRGPPVATPWEPQLAAALADHGRSVMEERLVAMLLDDLELRGRPA